MKSWFLSLSTVNKVMIVGMAVLFLSVPALLVYGIANHTEQGLLTACDTPNGSLDYNGECFEVKWDQSQIPLQLFVSSTTVAASIYPESARSSVVTLINQSLGFRMLSTTGEQDNADIVIDFETAQVQSLHLHNAHGGALHHRRSNGSLWCEVKTWNNVTAEWADKSLTHELGHCMGLAHDDFPASAMYPSPLTLSGDFRPTRLRFTDYDRNLLRRLYH